MVQLLTIPTALTNPASSNCPPWCTQHDDDFQMHIGDTANLAFDAATTDSTVVRTADVYLDADRDATPTIRVVINRGEAFQLPADDATAFALAILAQVGKTVKR